MNILDAIREDGESWDFALFTSYTFSLSYFESVILHELRQRRCKTIWVLVDEFGYRSAQIEKWSAHLGRTYRLVPIFVKDGIFHPKIMLLANENMCRLTVSSANLTYAAITSNLECLDIFDSTKTPKIFNELLGALETLSRSGSVILGDSAWLSEATTWLETIQSSPESETDSWLIATTEQSAFDSLQNLLPERLSRINVLSPFHDARGQVIERMQALYRPESVAIGVFNNASTYDFTYPKGSTLEKIAPRLDTGASQKELHAKIYEFHTDSDVFVMTGSVNATYPSFLTANNIEVSVVRKLAESPFEWDTIDDSTLITSTSQEEPTHSRNGIVSAKLTPGGNLSGNIFGYVSKENCAAHIILASGGTVRESAQVDVDEQGEFQLSTNNPALHNLTQSLTIRVAVGDTSYEGWVDIELALTTAKESGVAVGSLLNLVGGSQNIEDDLAVLAEIGKFVRGSGRIPSAVVSRRATSGAQETYTTSTTPIENLQQILAPRSSDEVEVEGGISGISNAKLLIPALLGSPELSTEIDGDESDFPDLSPAERNRLERRIRRFDRQQKERQKLLESLNETIEGTFLLDAKSVESNVLVLWFAVNIFVLVRASESSELVDFLAKWLARVEWYARSTGPLLLSDTLGWMYLNGLTAWGSSKYATADKNNLLQTLNSRFLDATQLEFTVELFDQYFQESQPFISLLTPLFDIPIADFARSLSESGSKHDVIEEIFALFASDETNFPTELEQRLGKHAKDFKRAFRSSSREKRLILVQENAKSCPHRSCFQNLGIEEQSELLSLGYTVCLNKHVLLSNKGLK